MIHAFIAKELHLLPRFLTPTLLIRFASFSLALLVPGYALSCEFPSSWERIGDPVLRDPILNQPYAYEVASDPHVFWTDEGDLRAVYTGDDRDAVSIKLAQGTREDDLLPDRVLLGASAGHPNPRYKETPFYRLSPAGEHQIYFIGYDDEDTYLAQVYLAVSDNLTGPYLIQPDPVMPRGRIADRDVHLITSPSVIEYDGQLYMVFLGWDDFRDVSEIWTFGAMSTDNGRSWHDAREVDVPIGMEGQVSVNPQGGFLATRTGGEEGREGIFINCADHPFGPYSDTEEPVLSMVGTPWEVDEIIGAELSFNPIDGSPWLYYTAADHQTGWWVMLARPTEP